MSRPYLLSNLVLAAMVLVFSLSSVAQDTAKDSAQCPKPSSWSYPSSSWPISFPKCCSQSNPETSSIQQSPINIASFTQNKELKLETNYYGVEASVVDKGYTIEVEYESAASAKRPRTSEKENYVIYNGTKYMLQQFHFHQPAEHEINGVTGVPMEVHLVNEAADGSLLVIGVLIKQGKQNEGFEKILANVGGEQNLDPIQMIPGTNNSNSLNFYTYTGSLTVPPCTPPVTWVVLKEPITFSPTQLNNYKTMSNGKYANTSRGVQTTITGLTVHSNFKP